MRGRRVREKNIRLQWTEADGWEGFRDFASVTEAREAREALPDGVTDWVISEIDHPIYAGVGRVLDAVRENCPHPEPLSDGFCPDCEKHSRIGLG